MRSSLLVVTFDSATAEAAAQGTERHSGTVNGIVLTKDEKKNFTGIRKFLIRAKYKHIGLSV